MSMPLTATPSPLGTSVAPAASARPGSRARVVVADDDGDQRLLVEIAVRRAGLDVVDTVADGDAALERTRALLPDLLLLDVSMPGRSGLEVCAVLRADPRTADVLVVLVTAAVQPEAVRAGLVAGADAYVTKPFRVRDLSERVAQMVAV
jgi:CheY-like chemotaxis protein